MDNMSEAEKNVMRWVPSEWQSATQSDEWNRVCDVLYGAVQACIQAEAGEDYDAYKCLVAVARQHRLDSVSRKYKEAA